MSITIYLGASWNQEGFPRSAMGLQHYTTSKTVSHQSTTKTVKFDRHRSVTLMADIYCRRLHNSYASMLIEVCYVYRFFKILTVYLILFEILFWSVQLLQPVEPVKQRSLRGTSFPVGMWYTRWAQGTTYGTVQRPRAPSTTATGVSWS